MVMNGRLSCTAETRAQDAVIVIDKRDYLHRNIEFSKIMLKAKKTIFFSTYNIFQNVDYFGTLKAPS